MRKRQSEDNNATNKQCKIHKIQNNNTKSQEIISTTKQKISTQTINNKNNKRRKIDNMKKLIKPEHKLKKLQIKLPNILISLHREHNKRTLTKAKEDNMLCKQYGTQFQITPHRYKKYFLQKDK